MLNFTRNCQHIFQSALAFKASFEHSESMFSPLQSAVCPEDRGVIVSGKTSFWEMLFPLGTWRRQSHKTSTWTHKINMAWTDFLTGGRVRNGNRGAAVGDISGEQQGTWWCNLDPKPGEILQFCLSLKHQVKGVMQNALPVKLKLLRVGGNRNYLYCNLICLPKPATKNCAPGHTCKSLSKSRESCVKCVPSIAHTEASGFSKYTNSIHLTPLWANFLKTCCQHSLTK